MPTNDERRKVAAKLWDMAARTNPLLPALVEALGTPGCAAAVMHLADLMEPEERTCRMEPTGDGSVVCSACRTEYTSRWLHEGEYVERYCPNCGAKVVDADA